MKKPLATMMVACMVLSGCVLVPVGHGPGPEGCPPGQAKKGNCAPHDPRGFCPPGQAKKGNC